MQAMGWKNYSLVSAIQNKIATERSSACPKAKQLEMLNRKIAPVSVEIFRYCLHLHCRNTKVSFEKQSNSYVARHSSWHAEVKKEA